MCCYGAPASQSTSIWAPAQEATRSNDITNNVRILFLLSPVKDILSRLKKGEPP